MISTLERNSEEAWKEKEMKKMIEDFKKSGYDENELICIKNKVMEYINNETQQVETKKLYFQFTILKDCKTSGKY